MEEGDKNNKNNTSNSNRQAAVNMLKDAIICCDHPTINQKLDISMVYKKEKKTGKIIDMTCLSENVNNVKEEIKNSAQKVYC